MKKIFSVILACMLLLSAIAASAESSICVRVNERTFTREQVQKYINQVTLSFELSMGKTLSDYYTADEQQAFLMDAAMHFVTMGVLREKLQEAGMEDLSTEEKEMLDEYAQTMYGEIWNRFSDQLTEAYPDMEIEPAFVTAVMEEAGYSMNDIYEAGLLSIQEARLIELYCGDVVCTDEELAAYYEENYVAHDRDKYQNDIAQFEVDAILQGGSSGYTPEGFYYIKFLAMTPSGERMAAIEAAEAALSECQAAQERVNASIVKAVLEGADVDALREQLLAAQADTDEAQTTLDAAKAAAAADFAPLMQIVLQAVRDGVSFDSIIDMYGSEGSSRDYSDDGYPFHPQSTIIDGAFVREVSQLEKYGDVTGPFFAGNKVYIVSRAADIRGGDYVPEESAMEALRAQLLYGKQTERLNELADEWRVEMDVEIDLTGLEFPQY